MDGPRGAKREAGGAGTQGGADRVAREVTSGIARGDRGALARLYEAEFERMYAIVRRCTGRDEAFCLDVVQGCFVRLIRGMPVLEKEAALRAYLRRTVLSVARDALRQEARRAVREGRGDVGVRAGAEPDGDGPVGRGGDAAERAVWLNGELARLDARDRALVEGRYRFGWTLARLGAAVGLGAGAVDGRLGRVVRGLRDRAGEVDDG